MWFFSVSMSPIGWLIAFLLALVLVLTPFFIVGAVADPLAEPLKTLVLVVGNYIVAPALVSYLYSVKMRKTGRGSAIFWIYCFFFALVFVITAAQLLTKELSFESVLGPIVTGAVTIFMVRFAYKTKFVHQENIDSYHAALREDDVRKQAEAILLADEIKNERDRT